MVVKTDGLMISPAPDEDFYSERIFERVLEKTRQRTLEALQEAREQGTLGRVHIRVDAPLVQGDCASYMIEVVIEGYEEIRRRHEKGQEGQGRQEVLVA